MQPVTTPELGPPQEQTICDEKVLLRRLEEEEDCFAYGNTEALDVADVDERGAVVKASFDQTAAVDIVGIIIFADRDAAGPVVGIDSLEGATDGAIGGGTDSAWSARIVAKRCIEAATSWLAIIRDDKCGGGGKHETHPPKLLVTEIVSGPATWTAGRGPLGAGVMLG